jgi:tRNA A-37 threonylcarbamoyl transferase component Bud32
MTVSAPPTLNLLDDLLLRWQDARAHGTPCPTEQLCAGHPELMEEVRQRIAALEEMHALLQLEFTTDEPTQPCGDKPEACHHGDLPEVPGHDGLTLIDEGGMGTVYRARQVRLQRPVAIKMVRAGRHARRDQLDRFRAEAQVVARLRHPNIIQIYEVGECRGQPYFSMEYVAGGNLAERLARGLPTPRKAAEIVRTLAEAMHHAHACGVVHRDLKPANVLLLRRDSTEPGAEDPWSFEPMVSDFGLAKLLDEEGPTRTGTVLGTPQYLAPEQAEGRCRDVGPATDVHALGALLYEMLAGRPPFLGTNTLEVLDQVRNTDPLPPSRVQPGIPRDLEVICLKCLAKEPERRYATAVALSEDLGRYLRGEPILARPASGWQRAVRWARRQPFQAGLVVLSVVAVVALLGVWAGFTRQLQTAATQLAAERDAATHQQRLAEEGKTKAQEEQHRAEQEKSRAEYLLGRCMAAIDEHARATEQSREWKQSTGEPGSIPYVVARVYAVSAGVYRNDPLLAQPDREAFADRYARKAVELLLQAHEHRYFESKRNRDRLLSDPDLSTVRERADFLALLKKLGIKQEPQASGK